MSMKEAPQDPCALDTLFARWNDQMDALEVVFAAPKPEPLVPGTALGRPVSEAWKTEMRKRTALLHPLAREMAEAYLHRLDDAGRRRAQALLAAHEWVQWQFTGVIRDWYERFLESLDPADLDMALALTAIYDAPTGSRDFQRTIYPIRARMKQRGLDAAALFEAAIPLATRHEDPEWGAHGLFVSLGQQWERAREE